MHVPKSITCIAAALLALASPALRAFDRTLVDTRDTKAGWTLATATANTARHELLAEGLLIDSDNFWTALFQFEKIGADLYRVPADAVVEIEARGLVHDRGPSLRVVLFDSAWGRATEFEVPLDELDPVAWKKFRSTRSWSEVSRPPATLGDRDVADHLFLNTLAVEGNQPWRLSVRRVALVSPAP